MVTRRGRIGYDYWLEVGRAGEKDGSGMAGLLHVALLVETSREYGRGLLQGIAHYVGERGPWSIYFRPMGLGEPPPPWLKQWRGDGILARIDNRKTANAVLETGLPTVDLRRALPELGLPHVGVANQAIVQLAAEHLLDRGFRHFGFCGTTRDLFQRLRCRYFQEFVGRAGSSCRAFIAGRGAHRAEAWEQEQRQIAAWVAALPKPSGVMAGNDEGGLQVLDGCRRAGVAVPDEVAVVGVDNDEYLCRLADPPLTSVDVNPMQIGYQAAALLARMMAGQTAPKDPIEIEPRGIVTRRSTDVLAIDDHQVAAAVQFIREQACNSIGVNQVANRLAVSRSTLERRFKKLLGRTPKAEILRVQLNQAKTLLGRTNLPVASVAHKSGFNSLKYFSETFQRKLGMAPGVYRKHFGRLE